jgi:hypothetical protein
MIKQYDCSYGSFEDVKTFFLARSSEPSILSSHASLRQMSSSVSVSPRRSARVSGSSASVGSPLVASEIRQSPRNTSDTEQAVIPEAQPEASSDAPQKVTRKSPRKTASATPVTMLGAMPVFQQSTKSPPRRTPAAQSTEMFATPQRVTSGMLFAIVFPSSTTHYAHGLSDTGLAIKCLLYVYIRP